MIPEFAAEMKICVLRDEVEEVEEVEEQKESSAATTPCAPFRSLNVLHDFGKQNKSAVLAALQKSTD